MREYLWQKPKRNFKGFKLPLEARNGVNRGELCLRKRQRKKRPPKKGGKGNPGGYQRATAASMKKNKTFETKKTQEIKQKNRCEEGYDQGVGGERGGKKTKEVENQREKVRHFAETNKGGDRCPNAAIN